ncbi:MULTISPECIES: glycosyltransferase family 2 protein [Methanobacterium]|uniref:glycosyltransferase family 2 protein n=1 Tax=Methanobacterium TaxID=2160 RepID=UPI000747FD2A|nr:MULTISPECIES: glycosyltransferase family 2 protein [Methanobacterium]KUK74346.1 MAG: Putative glycosyltransferase [Methanobacterium sp. 42_16]MDG3547869.1 glycosyltransferase family 2 protein [Methanobacterium formicicum]
MGRPRVSIVVLNWNGWEDTIECLESLFQINYPNFDVILVDNASEDDSLEKIRNYCSGHLPVKSSFFNYNSHNKPITVYEYYETFKKDKRPLKNENLTNKHITLIKNSENRGFPGGNNVGIKFALEFFDPDYILLLNNDTVVDENFLGELIKNGDSNDVGIMGPKIYFYDEPQTIWSAGCKISWKLSRGIQIGTNEVDTGQYNEINEVEYVSGSAFLIKTEIIKRIGLMDEDYFLYFEESDWTLRANQEGFKSLYVPTSCIWHKVSRSGGGISNPIGLYYITRNRWIFMRKWAGKEDYYFFLIFQISAAIIMPIFLSLSYHNSNLFTAYYEGLYNGIVTNG